MNNHKMTRAAGTLDILANVGGKLTAVVGAVCIVIAVLTLAFGSRMLSDAELTLDLDFIKFHLSDSAPVDEKMLKLYMVAGTLGGSVVCFLVYYVSKLLREILAPMKQGRPFEQGISGQLKKVGRAILLGGFFSELIGVVARFLLIRAFSVDELFASAAIAKTEYVFTIDLSFALIACVVFFLSYIFTYGQALQEESDETL